MEKDTYSYDGLAVLDRPITIDDQHIFGVLYNIERERQYQASGNGIPSYINYMVGAEQFLKNGGDIDGEGDLWTLPDGEHAFMLNKGMNRLLVVLMNGLVGFRRLEFGHPIEWNEGEVDTKDPGLVISQSLIDRYDPVRRPSNRQAKVEGQKRNPQEHIQ